MLSGDGVLFHVGNYNFKVRHMLVIAVLAIAFSTAFIMRSYPIKYGYYLNEFDPYFDYRATKYIIDNGLDAYLKWHDNMSWYPDGRDIPRTSQVGLHVTAAYLYKIFGGNSSVLDFTIILPVIVGSLTTIVVFALVRSLGGTTAGLFSALLIAFTPALIQRGNLGWFKSEPLGLFLALLALYLLISATKHRPNIAVVKAIAGGLLLGLANASWGGIQYFSIPISLFFFAVTFLRNDIKVPLIVAIVFTATTLFAAGLSPRPGLSFVFGLPGIALIGGTIFLIASSVVRKFSSSNTFLRNNWILIGAFFAIAIGIVISGSFHGSSFRYLNAVNPFLSSQNPLVESVAEHFTPTLVEYFTDYSILLMFAGFGALMAFKRRNDMSIFALIIGITGVYVSATFARLLVFSSIGIILLAGIGLYEITRTIMNYKATEPSHKRKRKTEVEKTSQMDRPIKIVYAVIVVVLVSIPVIDNGILYPQNSNWLSSADIPPSIANGGTGFRIKTNDWINALDWIAANTSSNSVVASWWDYGYWITTLANRTSLADNATINQTRIATIAKMFMDQTENGLKIAKDLKSDYIVVYIVGQRFSGINSSELYVLGNGGDESKKQWFIRIGGFDENRYLEQDGFTPTTFFWNSTLLGQLIPFTPVSYILNGAPSGEYQPGAMAIYAKHIKYPQNATVDQPLKLAYSSDSFNSNKPGLFFGVLVYEVNKNYMPKTISDPYNETIENQEKFSINSTSTTSSVMESNNQSKLAVLETAQGPITIEFFPQVAPNHVSNFEKLAESGFYNGTIFHRIVKGFVIQGGDPNTKNSTDKAAWGTGDPGYRIDSEFSNMPHERGIVSMARSSDPNSAGSQFFIVLNDSKFLDNQYTVFGRVVNGMDAVDKIAALATVQNDQPQDPASAKINSIKIIDRNATAN
ncbi:MAG: peptidylprolyl isomerase [Nitrososphaeraceae archaeon]|nr:peptidylprolyl isomerase [Nitrososphaeraceae archaeon]MDW0155547.1 peptidylprolyl isomerase [Nitrososphaeraceae archaeon]